MDFFAGILLMFVLILAGLFWKEMVDHVLPGKFKNKK